MFKQMHGIGRMAMGVAAALYAGASFAGPITVDGSLSDWGVSVPGTGNHTSSAWTSTLADSHYVAEDFVAGNGQVIPGYGGQNFDAEALYMYLDGSDLYIALATGFDQGGESGFYAGDMFVDLGTNGFDFALGSSTFRQGNVYDGSSYVTAQANSGIDWGQPNVPYRSTSSVLDTTPFAYQNDASTADHNVYEWCLALNSSQLWAIQNGGISLSWTMGCGNDVITGQWNPHVIIPEPATMLLLGMGIAGLAMRKRVRRA